MEKSQNEKINSYDSTVNHASCRSDHEDEYSLLDYLSVLWHGRRLILLGSLVSALLFCLALYLLPDRYKITYLYDVNKWGLNEDKKEILLGKFFSKTNKSEIISAFQKELPKDFHKVSMKLQGKKLEEFVYFSVSPLYPQLSRIKFSNYEQLKRFQNGEASLLRLTVIGIPEQNISKASEIIRRNFENIIFIYSEQKRLKNIMESLEIEIHSAMEMQVDIKAKMVSEKLLYSSLKELGQEYLFDQDKTLSVHPGSEGDSRYFPIEYQLRASKIKLIEQGVEFDKAVRQKALCVELRKLFEEITEKMNKNISSKISTDDYLAMVKELSKDLDEQKADLFDLYFNNGQAMFSPVPIYDSPGIIKIDKGILKKGGVFFFVLLMILSWVSIFRCSKKPDSAKCV